MSSRSIGPVWGGLLASLLLLACGPTAETPAKGEGDKADSSSLPPPTPAEVTIRVQRDGAGSTLAVPVGSSFAVELVGVPTAGYLWAPETTPPFLELTGTFSGPTIKQQLEPGYTGGNHWEVHVFNAMAAGEGELKLVQTRPWETDEPPADSFTISIRTE